MKISNGRQFAVFDIDGTLIRWQLYHVLADKLANKGLLGQNAKQQMRTARMVWKRRESSDSFKEYEKALIAVYEAAVRSLSVEDFDTTVHEVIDEYKDQTYKYTRDLLNELKKKGYVLLIVSGSHHELIEQIGKYYGFDDWVGTHYKRKDTSFSGAKIVGSQDKKASLDTLVTKHKLSYEGSVGIGDSGSDISMLEAVERPIAFNPDMTLFEAAKKHGWPVIVERKNMIYTLEAKDDKYILAKTD